jgi:hypothetical protein
VGDYPEGMNSRMLWSLILKVVGGIAMLLGTLDPMEGSVLILPGIGCAGHVSWREGPQDGALLDLGVHPDSRWRQRYVRIEHRWRYRRQERALDVVGVADTAVPGRLANGAPGRGDFIAPVLQSQISAGARLSAGLAC